MGDIKSTLNNFINEVKKSDELNQNHLVELVNFCNNCQYQTVIIDSNSRSIYHLNQQVEKYIGYSNVELIKSNITVALKLIHPEYAHSFSLAVAHFLDKEEYKKEYCYMYYLETAEGWQWTYACSKVFGFNDDQSPKYILVVADSVNNIINTTTGFNKLIEHMSGFENLEVEKYQTLTKREKDILILISKEWTSIEIAKHLFLSKASIDAYRKKILKKLNVKSAIGLTKYVLLFGDDED